MSTFSILSLISAFGVKTHLNNVQLLNKLRLGAFPQLFLSGRSTEITNVINSRHFSLSTCLFLRDPRHGRGFRDYNDGLAPSSSSSLSLPDHTERKPSYGVSRSSRRGDVSADSNNHIYDQLQSFHNPADLLEFIESTEMYQLGPEVLDGACSTLCDTLKKESLTDADKKRLLFSLGMQKLCRVVKKHCRNLTAEELIGVTKLFIHLNAPGTHPTFQIILRLLSKHANTFSLVNILYLNFLLGQMSEISRSPLSEALTLALPIIFESQLDIQLDEANLWELVDCLQYAMKVQAPEKTVKRILEPIVRRQMELNHKQANSIIWAFVKGSKFNLPEINEVLDTCFRCLANSIHLIDLKQLNLLLNICGSKSQIRSLDHFYNEDFVEAACNRLVETRQSDFKLVLSCFKYISVLRHVNLDLVEYIADVVASDPKIILHDDSAFLGIVRGFSSANYKPEKWNALEPLLLDHPAICKESSTQDIGLTLDFLTLDVLPNTLLHRIFSPDYFSNLESWYTRSGPFTLIMIHNALKHLHPEYSGPMPPASMVEQWRAKTRELKDANVKHLWRLEGALQAALGGESYVMSGIVHEGVYIDHCVVMRQGGYPIAVQDRQPLNLDHIERPDYSFLILIKAFEREAYSNNTKRLRGIHALESKILAGFGHCVLEVDMWTWRRLMDSEKIPWLMRQIREHAGKAPSTSEY